MTAGGEGRARSLHKTTSALSKSSVKQPSSPNCRATDWDISGSDGLHLPLEVSVQPLLVLLRGPHLAELLSGFVRGGLLGVSLGLLSPPLRSCGLLCCSATS